jgi:CTP synthase
MPKYIFVTGGVVSGLGKGITTAATGLLLKTAGYTVDAIKFDPYLNIDPGTMSPYEHGEVYVLQDGAETDLDLGHYERFLDTNLTHTSSVSAGKIYDQLLNQEREGKFLGKNVQLIPHTTNFIKNRFQEDVPEDPNFVRLIEIGGSSGDMEAEIFLESFRQFKQENPDNILHLHLGYIPFLKCSGEYKTKPLQNSLRELLKMGLQPDVLVARHYPERGKKLPQESIDKIALFGNVESDAVISLPDLDSIYKVPVYLQEETQLTSNLEKFMGQKLSHQLTLPEFYYQISHYKESTHPEVKIGIVAKYPKLTDAYLSLLESLKIAGVNAHTKVKPVFLDAEKLLPESKYYESEMSKLREMQGIIVPGGFGVRGMEGKIKAIEYARMQQIPFLGLCLGLQLAVVEFARNVAGINAYSAEMLENIPANEQPENPELVIDLIPEQKKIHRKGGTMRLGEYQCDLVPETVAAKLFEENEYTGDQSSKASEKSSEYLTIFERHRHRLEVQNQYLSQISQHGLVFSGFHHYTDEAGENKKLVELIELPTSQHPYFMGTQSHPEFLSRPDKPHPLFLGLVRAAKEEL